MHEPRCQAYSRDAWAEKCMAGIFRALPQGLATPVVCCRHPSAGDRETGPGALKPAFQCSGKIVKRLGEGEPLAGFTDNYKRHGQFRFRGALIHIPFCTIRAF